MHALDQAVEPFHLLKHPFYQRWVAGNLSLDELRQYAAQYYPHVAAFPRYVSAVHSQVEDPKLRRELLENLIEEERGEENHPELWMRFAEGVGANRRDLSEVTPLPESSNLVDTFHRLSRFSAASGLGALYAYESQVPAIADQKIAGLWDFYGFKNERGLKFFRVHLEADNIHSATARNAFDKMTEDEKGEAIVAAKSAAESLWNFLSGLDRANGREMPGECCAA